MLKLKLQYFGHLMQRADSFEKTLMLGKMEGRRQPCASGARLLRGKAALGLDASQGAQPQRPQVEGTETKQRQSESF